MFTKISQKSLRISKSVGSKVAVRPFAATSAKTQKYIDTEKQYVTPYYPSPPIVIERGQGIYLWDVDGKKYYDMLAGFACVSQGHCHPKIVEAMYEQAKKLTMCSRSLISSQIVDTSQYLCDYVGFDMYLAASSGVEACEAAVKLARKWGYTVKGIEDGKASVILMNDCFWGRSITASGNCTDPMRYTHFGPHTPGFHLVPYSSLSHIEEVLQADPNVCAIMLEPIQGEGGTIIPYDGYLRDVRRLADKYGCLLICDEVQSGLGRTGKILAQHHEFEGTEFKADIVTLGKALTGAVTPGSGIVADKKVMSVFKVGDHGSTYGGNPLTMAIVKAAIQVLKEEGMVENSLEVGTYMKERFRSMSNQSLIREVRGRGLMNAIEVERNSSVTGDDFADILRGQGLLTKATKNYICRFTPALNITKQEVDEVVEIVDDALFKLEQLNEERTGSRLYEAHHQASMTK